MFKHKVAPEVQTQIDALRRDLIEVTKIIKEYEAGTGKAIRQILETLTEYEAANTKTIRQIAETVDGLGRAVAKLAEERLGRDGTVPENPWKQ